MVVPLSLPAAFALTANLTYGDNAPAADGIPAWLQWRTVAARKSEEVPYADVVGARSAGGTLGFAGVMPPQAEGAEVELRVCVAQPGGVNLRCGADAKTTVSRSRCSLALSNQAAYHAVLNRLGRKLRRAKRRHQGRAKRTLKRQIKFKREKLEKADRAVQAHC